MNRLIGSTHSIGSTERWPGPEEILPCMHAAWTRALHSSESLCSSGICSHGRQVGESDQQGLKAH